jgi:hypothetical protein
MSKEKDFKLSQAVRDYKAQAMRKYREGLKVKKLGCVPVDQTAHSQTPQPQATETIGGLSK